ncbi:hypothetical protein, partial [Blastococcus sp. CCUG 61487]|uniref:hypothetical protein n=1 Tax=Blastococcus sp. CCUG 61487 TaxID=1840703 RepID=UPI0010BF7F25
MALAIYQELVTGRLHWAESTSSSTQARLATGQWVLYDDTPTTPPPSTDPLGSEMAQRVAPGTPFGDALRAASELL